MAVILYHGSDKIVNPPDPYYNNPDNDFGRGFYLADDYQVSAEWACMSPNWTNHIVNQYDFDWDGLRVLDFLDGTHSVLEWFGTMLIHRKLYKIEASMIPAYNFLRDTYGIWTLHDDYDVVVSWRADDSYFNISQVFLTNGCDVEGLKWAMSRGFMREQIVLVNPNAFANLSNPQYDDVGSGFYSFNRQWRDRQETAKREVNSLFVQDPEGTIAMLMAKYDIINTSNDFDEIEAARAWIQDYERRARIERTY